MRRLLIPLFSLVLVALALSCGKRPAGILSERKMVDVLTDMEIAQAYDRMMNSHNSDSARYLLGESVLRKHGVTKAEVDSTLAWYGHNMDLYDELYDKVGEEILRRQRNMSGLAEDVASDDLWPYSRYIQVTENGPSNTLTFSLPPEKFNAGDALKWNIHSPMPISVTGMLGVDYEDGMTAYTVRNITSMRQFEFSIQTDTSKNVKRIFGSINASSPRNLPLWLDSIALTVHPYDSAEYYKVSSQRRYYGLKKRLPAKEVPEDSVK